LIGHPLREDRARIGFLLRRQRNAVEVAMEQPVDRIDLNAAAAASATTPTSRTGHDADCTAPRSVDADITADDRTAARIGSDGRRSTAATTTGPRATPTAAKENRITSERPSGASHSTTSTWSGLCEFAPQQRSIGVIREQAFERAI